MKTIRLSILVLFLLPGPILAQQNTFRDSLIQVVQQGTDTVERIKTANYLAMLNSSPTKTILYASQALEESQLTGSLFQEGRALNHLGHAYEDMEEDSIALIYCHQELAVFRRFMENEYVPRVQHRMSEIYLRLDNKLKADSFFLESIRYWDTKPDKLNWKVIYRFSYAYGLQQKGYYQDALDLCREGIRLIKELDLDEPDRIFEALITMGELKIGLGDPEGGLSDLLRAKTLLESDIASEWAMPHQPSMLNSSLAKACLTLSRFTQAQESLEISNEQAEEYGFDFFQIENLRTASELAAKQGQDQKASALLKEFDEWTSERESEHEAKLKKWRDELRALEISR